MNLTPEAQSALLAASPRVGALVDPDLPLHTPGVIRELEDLGLIQAGNGLTRKGLTTRNRIMDRRLEEAFS